jgi:hypothetical protein
MFSMSIKAVQNDNDSEIRKIGTRIVVELRLMRWMLGMSMVLSTVIIVLLAKLFFALPH